MARPVPVRVWRIVLSPAPISETPVFFGEGGALFGIMTTGARVGALGAAICLTPGMGESPVGARLARRLAESGFPALRFDLPGKGESIASSAGSDLNNGDVYRQAVDWMAGNSLDSFVIIGGSQGARAALAAAGEVRNLHGFVFTRLALEDRIRRAAQTVSLGEHIRRAVKPSTLKALADSERRRRMGELARAKLSVTLGRSPAPGKAGPSPMPPSSDAREMAYDWSKHADPTALAQLQDLIDRRVPMLMVSGAEDTDQSRMRRVLAGRLPDLEATSLEMASVPARTLKGFRSVAAQHQFVELVVRWIGERAAGRA